MNPMPEPAPPRAPSAGCWNHNAAYYPLVLGALPDGAAAALDVGCGDGALARRLRAAGCPRVVGIDRSPEMIAQARGHASAGASAGDPDRDGDDEGDDALTFIAGDFLEHPLPEAGFDLVSFVASLHHMDFAAGLARAAALLRPGGRLAVVGLARNRSAADWIISGLKLPVVRVAGLRRDYGEPPDMPVLAAAMGYRETVRQARDLLPSVHCRRHLYYRYSMLWTKPVDV